MRKQEPCATIFGVGVDRVPLEKLHERMLALLGDGERHKITYVNIHVLNIAYKDRELAKIINSAELVYPDGAGAILGARILGRDLGERLTGADWIDQICRALAKTNYRIFILAGENENAIQAARILAERYPGLKIAGVHHGYFDKESCDEILSLINYSRADLLFVGFGSPLQEKWIAANEARLMPRLIWPVGALFDFVTGRIQRGPRPLLDHGFEWLARLIAEPGKLWQRYLVGNPLFIFRVLKEKYFGWKEI